jgi:hypothetical protein
MGATALHYGQSCFEGLKAFAHQDGSVHVFRPDENAKRYDLLLYCQIEDVNRNKPYHLPFLFLIKIEEWPHPVAVS